MISRCLKISTTVCHPPNPLAESKVKYLNFTITKLSIFLTATLHTARGTIDIKHIKQDFSFKVPWVDVRDLAEAKNQLFWNTVIMHIKLKGMKCMLANILPSHTLLSPGVGSKHITFSESSHVAYQIKGNEAQNIMQANILPLHLYPWGQNIFFY